MSEASAPMQLLGQIEGVRYWWAEPGRFTSPGVYYWNGSENVRLAPPKPDTAAHVPIMSLRECMEAEENVEPDTTATREGVPSDLTLRALRAAQSFIRNGRELGFIRMPDADVPDPAHETPKLIDAAIDALAASTKEQTRD